MFLKYREDKTTQAAGRILRLSGGRMPYMSLIKLLYFADRRALINHGRPISYDFFVSMPHGPVLSRTYGLIIEEPDPDQPSYWRTYISEPDNYKVELTQDVPNDQLSPAEEEILDQVSQEFGHLNQWQLRDFAHTLPEWRDPHGSSVPIDLGDILTNQGLSAEEAEAIVEELAAAQAAAELTG